MSARALRRGFAALVLTTVGGVTAVAVAQMGDTAADPVARPNTVVTAVEPDQVAAFSVLRGETGVAAELTPEAQRLIKTGFGPDVGASAALARQAGSTPDGTPLYVVPGDGWVCLAAGDGVGGCNRTDAVVEGYGVLAHRHDAGVAISGIVPDGIATVEVTGPQGSVQVPVAANVWSALTPFDPDAVHWTDPGGAEHDIPVWVPPPGVVAPGS